MRQIIKKDVMSLGINWKIIMLSFICVTFLLCTLPVDEYISVISYFILVLAPLIYFMNIFNYTEMDYYKSELFLPIKRYKIVFSRYFEYTLITLMSMGYIAIIINIRKLVHEASFQEYQINTIYLGVAFTILFAANVLAGSFILGNDKIKIFGISAFVVASLLVKVYIEILGIIYKLEDPFGIYNYKERIMTLIFFAIIIFIASYFLSLIGFNARTKR